MIVRISPLRKGRSYREILKKLEKISESRNVYCSSRTKHMLISAITKRDRHHSRYMGGDSGLTSLLVPSKLNLPTTSVPGDHCVQENHKNTTPLGSTSVKAADSY